jgi:hypothetical protein
MAGGGRATGCGLSDRGPGAILFSLASPDATWGPDDLVLIGYRVPCPSGLMLPEREADHSPPNSAESKRKGIHTSTPPYAVMKKCLIS